MTQAVMRSHLGAVIIGLNGAGKSTLAHALAGKLGLYEMDVEDYYFPDQKASRAAALDGGDPGSFLSPGLLPFSSPRQKEDVEKDILRDIRAHPRFVLSGVTMRWREEIIAAADCLIIISVPRETRIARIRRREEFRFGARVLPGGDMYDGQREFREIASKRTDDVIADTAAMFSCPRITIDGTAPLSDV
ncbi:MAG: hypothetical protein K6D94_07300, partial [Clostridiales bacterium]|nr:hypothetical protein [Clostridiales bacterium]